MALNLLYNAFIVHTGVVTRYLNTWWSIIYLCGTRIKSTQINGSVHSDFSFKIHIALPRIQRCRIDFHSVFQFDSVGRWCIVMLANAFVYTINTLRPRQNGRHFADDTFKRIFLNENVIISIKISLKFVPKGPINTIPALVQIMAWRRPGDKPLSEAMMVSLLTHICVTRPQWVKHLAIPVPFYTFE